MSRGATPWRALVALGSLLACAAFGAEPITQRRVAITFDDLPAARSSFHPDLVNSPEAFIRRNKKFLRELRKMKVPAAGLVSRSFQPSSWAVEDVQAFLRVWEKSGAALGNHTASHRDYHETDPDAFLEDIMAGQQFLESVLGEQASGKKYFRAPYLHRGATKTARDRLAQHLEEHSYSIAPVTIDLQDWIFAEIYAWADANGDLRRRDEVVPAYLGYLDAAIEHYAQLSVEATGRQTPHVALLHANALNYDHIGEVIRRFEALNFEFISLETALQDPIYREAPSASGSWIRGWQEQEGLPWVAAPDPKLYLGSVYNDFQKRGR